MNWHGKRAEHQHIDLRLRGCVASSPDSTMHLVTQNAGRTWQHDLCLEYPNGRTHHVDVPEEIKPGQEFNLYGHR